MALVKKGSRRITIDGDTYRWRLRGRPTYDQGLCCSPLTYAVELAEQPGATLVVTTSQPHPSNWFERPAAPVLPSDVAHAIRLARAAGWIPENPGSPFHLTQPDAFVPPP
ncbi:MULTISPECIES: hypothetical protein [Streptomyces]|uniref:hypothetical protein n=1 Tax=Streptomyces TaxID=1883 RepID=UPI000699D410|nr:hypothetical protein [Streptomyces sp. SID7805]MYU55013.1 hypothetical protein [Streptomyces sp. SID7805]